jgi:hypothetical protein
MFPIIQEKFGAKGVVKNDLQHILTTARIPTSQQDIFSFLLQLVADHLLGERSNAGPEQIDAFRTLLTRGRDLVGAGHRIPHLDTQQAQKCMKGWHWYPAV